jgi:hypothetical protein
VAVAVEIRLGDEDSRRELSCSWSAERAINADEQSRTLVSGERRRSARAVPCDARDLLTNSAVVTGAGRPAGRISSSIETGRTTRP